MQKTQVLVHKENGVIHLEINGMEIANVSDYKIISSAHGKTELTFTITADGFMTDLETGLTGN